MQYAPRKELVQNGTCDFKINIPRPENFHFAAPKVLVGVLGGVGTSREALPPTERCQLRGEIEQFPHFLQTLQKMELSPLKTC